MTNKNAHEVRWALEHVNNQYAEQITDTPWSKVFRLYSQSGENIAAHWLKVIPPHRTYALQLNELIAHYFPQQVPPTVASDPYYGAIISADHQGRPVSNSPQEHAQLLQAYAHMQLHAWQTPELLEKLPTFSTENTFVYLREFLKPSSTLLKLENRVTLIYFLPAHEQQRYAQLLETRLPLLQQFCAQTAALPHTLNHGDLRTDNAAISSKGNVIIFDWDEAVNAPIGLSLYDLFGGCSSLFRATLTDREDPQAPLIMAYLQPFIEQGFAPESVLRQALPVHACLGVIHYVLSFSFYTIDDEALHAAIADNIRHSLDDLLQLADYLYRDAMQDATPYVQDYLQTNYLQGVDHCCRLILERTPQHTDAKKWLLHALIQTQRYQDAASIADQLLSHSPQQPELLFIRGNLYQEALAFTDAIPCYQHALQLDPSQADIQTQLKYAQHLHAIQQQAQITDQLAHLQHNPDLFTHNSHAYQHYLKLAQQLFMQQGALVIKNLFSEELINNLLQQYHHQQEKRELPHSDTETEQSSYCVGDRRYLQSYPLNQATNHPEWYGSRLLLDILTGIFQEAFILGSLSSVTAKAGAAAQQWHKDQNDLFQQPSHDNTNSPCFAVTVLVPLVATTPENGGTRLIKGSHHLTIEDSACLPQQSAYLERGDCLLFDYRLTHQGMANHSHQDRPVLSLVYQRSWFRDSVNFNQIPALTIDADTFNNIPADLKPLLAWSQTGQTQHTMVAEEQH